MKRIALLILIMLLFLATLGEVSAQTEPKVLFEVTHYGHDRGNWNVGLWRYFGDGTQIPYRVTTPCGTFYAGGPVNKGPNGRVIWDWGTDDDAHQLTISYNPGTRSLSLTVVGSTTVSETTTSPHIDKQAYCDPEWVLYAGGEGGKVNNLHIVLAATAGTSVQTCGPSNWGCRNIEVSYTMTDLSNLQLNGQSPAGASVSASLSDNPTATEFTNKVSLDIPVPNDQPWTLTGDLGLQITRADGNDGFVPKQWRVGMIAYGQYVERPIPATVNVDPDTLNLKSKGNWITAYVELPAGYSVNDIDLTTVKLGDIPASWGEIQDTVLMVKFDRQQVAKTLSPGSVSLTITGKLTNGQPFTGSDTISVISR